MYNILSKSFDMYYDATNLLIAIYTNTGRTEKAVERTNTLTPMKYCREFAKQFVLIRDLYYGFLTIILAIFASHDFIF